MTKRRIVIGVVAAAVLGVLAWVASEVVWAFNAAPTLSVDYAAKMNERVAAAQPAGENGWPVLLDALAAAKRGQEAATAKRSPGGAKPADWPEGAAWPPKFDECRRSATPEVRAALTALLPEFDAAGVRARLDAVAKMGTFTRTIPTGGPLVMVLLPELQDCRTLAAACRARQQIAHAAGDWPEVVRSYEHQIALADALGRQATLIDRLVAFAIVSKANTELRAELVENAPDAATLGRLRAAMDRHLPLPAIAGALESERMFALDLIQNTYTDDGHGGGRLIQSAALDFNASGGVPRPSGTGRLKNLLWFTDPGRAATTRELNMFYDHAVSQSALARNLRDRTSMDMQIENLRARGFRTLAVILPALGSAVASADAQASDVAGTRLHLALEQFKAARGDYPRTLADLVPEFLSEVPSDAITNQPFGYYRLVPGADEQRRGFLLYSLGRDGQDNDGKTPEPAPGGAAVCAPGSMPGYDEVLNTTVVP